MKLLVTCNGSYGDVYPFIGLSRALLDRGHDVTLLTSDYFRQAVTRAFVPFVGLGSADDYGDVVRNPDLTHPQKGLGLVADAVVHTLPETYKALDDLADDDTVVVGSTLAMAAGILHDRRGIRWVPVHLAPSIFRSNIDPPRVTPTPIPSWFPGRLLDFFWWSGDRFVIDPSWCPGINRFRDTLGLPPVSRIFRDWIHSPDLTIGFFPDWFGRPQPDWPPGVRLTSFPLYDQGEEPLSDEVNAFLDAGDPPVVFVCGTAIASESRFYAASVDACVKAGMRGLVLTRFPEQLPDPLPDGVRHFESIPFSRLLPRCAAIVHHGGVGTLSQSIQAGIPQIVRPYGFDQFDNASRLVDLGVAAEISVRRYRATHVGRELERVSNDAGMKSRCREMAERLAVRDGIGETCELLEQG